MSDRAFLGPADTYLENRQIVFAEDYDQLERELAEAKVEINTWKAVAEARLENFHHYHDESLAYQAKLTAHKAALNLCQMALNADNHETYLELKAEALSEIAKLKGTK